MSEYIKDLVDRLCDLSDREANPLLPSEEDISWKAHREAEKLADEKYVSEVIEFIKHEKNAKRRDGGYYILGKLAKNTGSEEAVRFLVARLGEEKTRYIKKRILGGLVGVRKPRSLSMASIYEVAQSSDKALRLAAISALGSSDDPSVEEKVLEILGSTSDKYELFACLEVLEKNGTERSIPLLQDLVEHARGDVSINAETIIITIRRRTPGANDHVDGQQVPPSEKRLSALLEKINAEPLPEPCGRKPGDTGNGCKAGRHWAEYELYETGVSVPLEVLPRRDARRVFKHCVDTREDRVERLARLVRGCGVELGVTDEAIQRLHDWFLAHIEPHPHMPGELDARWHSIIHDVAMYLGEVLFERYPNLRWELYIWGKTNIYYHQHVIMGFSTMSPRSRFCYGVEPTILSHTYRTLVNRGSIRNYGVVEVRDVKVDLDRPDRRRRKYEEEPDFFVRLVKQIGNTA